jgi:5-methylcytosine-specific restriction endonuclease McrA
MSEYQRLKYLVPKKKKRKRKRKNRNARPVSKPKKNFYQSAEWRRVRYKALLRANGHCEACGRGPEHGAVLNVDHVLPLKHYPEKALDLDNTQVLCGACNHGKGNWDETRWADMKKAGYTEVTAPLSLCQSCYEIVEPSDSCPSCRAVTFH